MKPKYNNIHCPRKDLSFFGWPLWSMREKGPPRAALPRERVFSRSLAIEKGELVCSHVHTHTCTHTHSTYIPSIPKQTYTHSQPPHINMHPKHSHTHTTTYNMHTHTGTPLDINNTLLSTRKHQTPDIKQHQINHQISNTRYQVHSLHSHMCTHNYITPAPTLILLTPDFLHIQHHTSSGHHHQC